MSPWARDHTVKLGKRAFRFMGRAERRALKPELVKIYTTNFSEPELKELVAFYQSPLGKKVLEKMPQLTQQSAQMTQAKLESAVPVVNKLLSLFISLHRFRFMA